MGNYKNSKRLLIREDLLNPFEVCFHNCDTERFGALSVHTLQGLPEFVRFFLAMRKFSSH
jgi:hypothetical protein